ncbi:uncharacterized protein BDR25DRAFT_338948 [Lindgomyces ingoldianus]|uniref:Uncharacterized protein n=1 Tax=Lindgomyces ingoldianus TaxID=673940 RepID=A0ACB6RGA2_9PLEO|nr:uncharacterized protein BDR25DRAFT_338948 [Lindgomyces ingoldianus]KAF2478399.1 hypothetical protein BDR25DRAFT_338948 [Lindgomyces ingoldianus]
MGRQTSAEPRWERSKDGTNSRIRNSNRLISFLLAVEREIHPRILPNNHGQIWTELATLSSLDSTLFQGPKTEAEQEMLEHLQLSGQVKFPMASCRIDDFWFTTFHLVINSISRIRSEFSIEVQSSDWIKLASLPQVQKPADVQQLFYPNLDNNKDVTLSRQQNLFITATNNVYDGRYQFVLSRPDLGFANVHSLLKTTKQEGKVMSIVIAHISRWLNRDPARVGERDKDVLPGLRERYGDVAEKQSIKLQEQVLGRIAFSLA